jgi:hypothetical protein
MKRSNSRRLITHGNTASPRRSTKSTFRSEPMVPKVTVEITGADDATQDAIKGAIVRALHNITSRTNQ